MKHKVLFVVAIVVALLVGACTPDTNCTASFYTDPYYTGVGAVCYYP